MITAAPEVAAPAVSRSVMAGLDIAERRLQQDGESRSSSAAGVDIRVSTVPLLRERAFCALLDRGNVLFGLADMGFEPADLATFERFLSRSSGILLVTGPTGSEDHHALRRTAPPRLGNEEHHHDRGPVGVPVPGIGQIQVNPKIQLTFASGLRSILRQDPDIIMVGEIRDAETARSPSRRR